MNKPPQLNGTSFSYGGLINQESTLCPLVEGVVVTFILSRWLFPSQMLRGYRLPKNLRT